jgi:hypothetical protein
LFLLDYCVAKYACRSAICCAVSVRPVMAGETVPISVVIRFAKPAMAAADGWHPIQLWP